MSRLTLKDQVTNEPPLRGRPCSFGPVVLALSAKMRAQVSEILADRAVSNERIAAVLERNGIISISSETIGRHRVKPSTGRIICTWCRDRDVFS